MIQHELEQQIMRCWAVCDDIADLRDLRDSMVMTEDQVDNYLLGMQTIYQAKFEKLFSLFEQLLREQSAEKNLP